MCHLYNDTCECRNLERNAVAIVSGAVHLTKDTFTDLLTYFDTSRSVSYATNTCLVTTVRLSTAK